MIKINQSITLNKLKKDRVQTLINTMTAHKVDKQSFYHQQVAFVEK